MERCRNRKEGGRGGKERERGSKTKQNKKKRKDTQNRKKNNRGDQYRLTITLLWSRSNGKAYCIRPLDGSPWSGEARIVLMHLTFYCNQTGQPQKKKKKVFRPGGSTEQNWNQRLNTQAQRCFFLLLCDKCSEVCKKCTADNTLEYFLSSCSLLARWSRCLNPSNVQFSCYIINVFIIDKMPRAFPLEEIIPICK